MEGVVVAAVAALRMEGQEVEQPPATAAAEAAAEAIALCHQQEVLSLTGVSLLLAAIPILITCRVSVSMALEREPQELRVT
jgi:uncharacterized membrane protein